MWLNRESIKGVLLDVTGVLYESGTNVAIPGSVQALKDLLSAGIPVRLVTNETQHTRSHLLAKLTHLGYEELQEEHIIAPSVAVKEVIEQRKLRPFLLVHPELLPDFDGCDTINPNCVVVGDAADDFTYKNMNKAFHVLLENPQLISMGKGKFYKDKGELALDLGAYTTALEFACGVKAEIVGKPSEQFFMKGVHSMGLTPDKVVMVGDDIMGDVGGAQSAKMKGVLVRTGKYRVQDETHPDVKPDMIVDNLKHFVSLLLSHKD